MPKRDRAESYATLLQDFAPVVSPTEAKPKKFALVLCDGDDNDGEAFITTHDTLNKCVEQIEADESEFQPSIVIDLDSGKNWDPEVEWTLEEGVDPDYFSNEIPALNEEEEATE